MEQDLYGTRLDEARAAGIEVRWRELQKWLKARFRRDTDASIEHILFLIGIQERGRGFEPDLEKEVKQDVIMEGTCAAFASIGLYEHVDDTWRRTARQPDDLSLEAQEMLLQYAILTYFEDVVT